MIIDTQAKAEIILEAGINYMESGAYLDPSIDEEEWVDAYVERELKRLEEHKLDFSDDHVMFSANGPRCDTPESLLCFKLTNLITRSPRPELQYQTMYYVLKFAQEAGADMDKFNELTYGTLGC